MTDLWVSLPTLSFCVPVMSCGQHSSNIPELDIPEVGWVVHSEHGWRFQLVLVWSSGCTPALLPVPRTGSLLEFTTSTFPPSLPAPVPSLHLQPSEPSSAKFLKGKSMHQKKVGCLLFFQKQSWPGLQRAQIRLCRFQHWFLSHAGVAQLASQ